MSEAGPLVADPVESSVVSLAPAVEDARYVPRQGSGTRRRDPLATMLGQEVGDDPFFAGIGVALALHITVLLVAVFVDLLKDMRVAMLDERKGLEEYLNAVYDVEVDKPKPPEPPKAEDPPPPAPEPEKVPAPLPAAKPVAKDDPFDQPPPSPAQASKVLTAKEEPEEVADLTGNTIVSGEGTATYGMQAVNGKGNVPTMNRAATLQGVPGGRGTAPVQAPPPPPPGPDLSRSISLAGGSSWNCPFPPEADADQIDQATVTVQITVRPDGSVLSATVVSDPGHGFGRAARLCALQKRLSPALDRTGTPILSSAPVTVRFSR